MKAVEFPQSGRTVEIHTQENLLQALLADEVPVAMACGGKGLCATCHVFIEQGSELLTPMTKREGRTLGLVTEAGRHSRLACQARILGDGVVVRLPDGLYIQKSADLMDLVGRRAESRLLHPITGAVLVPEGKIITRSTVVKLKDIDLDMQRVLNESREIA